MAVIINITVPTKGNLEFDFTNSLITAQDTIDTLTNQELANAIRDATEELVALAFPHIANMSGKTDLGNSVFTGIVIELLNDWKIVTSKTTGTFTVLDGTTLRTASAGEIFAINNTTTQINLMTQSGTISVTGSGVTPEDIEEIADAVWEELEDDHKTSKTMGDHLARIKNQKV